VIGDNEGSGYFLNSPGATWSPDGHHFLFQEAGPQASAFISDAEGQIVASIASRPGFDGSAVWSPDSTRLHAWTDHGMTIFGIDGVLQTTLPLPDGFERIGDAGVWAPDGRSVWVWIQRHQTYPCNVPHPADPVTHEGDCFVPEFWELLIDGSPPRQVAEDLPFDVQSLSFSPDGTRMAFSGVDPVRAAAAMFSGDEVYKAASRPQIYVANRDGADARAIIRADQDPDAGHGWNPVWSSRGDQLAYLSYPIGGQILLRDHVDLRVVDLATGLTRNVAGVAAFSVYEWSAAGDALLYSSTSEVTGEAIGSAPTDDPTDERGPMSLWRVSTEGGIPTLVVRGATDGAWQPPVAP
jgi:Tol biopolymer transport system component